MKLDHAIYWDAFGLGTDHVLWVCKSDVNVFSCLLDTEADLTEIVNRVQKSTHQAVAEIEVQLFWCVST